MKTKWCYTDKSVRDHGQQAIIQNDVITVKSKCGRETIGKYSFTLKQWNIGTNSPTFNIAYNTREFIIKQFIKVFRYYPTKNGYFNCADSCLADRIIDSEIRAIHKVITLRALPEKEVL